MIDVESRVTKLSARLGNINLDLVGSPGLRVPEVSKQVHSKAIQPDLPHVVVEPAGLLEHRILSPGPNGELVDLVVDVDEAGLLDAAAHQWENVDGAASLLRGLVDAWSPHIQDVVLGQAAVVAEDFASALVLLEPAARLEVVVGLLVDGLPFRHRVGAQSEAQVDQVEWLAPGPFLEDVVDF